MAIYPTWHQIYGFISHNSIIYTTLHTATTNKLVDFTRVSRVKWKLRILSCLLNNWQIVILYFTPNIKKKSFIIFFNFYCLSPEYLRALWLWTFNFFLQTTIINNFYAVCAYQIIKTRNIYWFVFVYNFNIMI